MKKRGEGAAEKDDAPKADDAGGKYKPPSMRQRMEEEEEGRRGSRGDDDRRPAFGSNTRSAGGDGKYVPAHMKKKQEEEDRRQKAEDEKAAAEAQAKQKAEDEKAAAEKARKKEIQEKKDAEKKAARELIMGAKAPAPKKVTSQTWDEEKIESFSEACKELVSKTSTDVSKKLKDTTSMLTEAELQTVQPVSCLLEQLLQHSREKADDEVKKIVQRFAPLINCLIEESGVHRFKVKVLCECQRLAYSMGLPRLSPKSALLEVFFDGLYVAEIIEEGYFDLWANCDDETPGKMKAMFQVNDFLEWLRTAKVEGEESSSDEGEEGEEESGSDESDDDDVTANVPKGPRR